MDKSGYVEVYISDVRVGRMALSPEGLPKQRAKQIIEEISNSVVTG